MASKLNILPKSSDIIFLQKLLNLKDHDLLFAEYVFLKIFTLYPILWLSMNLESNLRESC